MGSTGPAVWLDTPLDGVVISSAIPLDVLSHVTGVASPAGMPTP
jgi:hypothetical protein